MARRPQPHVDRELWIDEEWIPWGEATTHILSHSHQRGSLIFDFLGLVKTDRGPAVFRLPEHVARLLASAELVGLRLDMNEDTLCSAIIETVRRNPGSTVVKISAYLPSIEIDVVPVDDQVSIAIAAYDPEADISAHKLIHTPRPETLRVWIEKNVRNRRKDIVPPQAKVAANYASPMQAKARARQAGYDDILLVDEDGYVAEGPTSNVFLVDRDGTLVTPPAASVLHGVTRRSTIEIAEHDGISVREQRVRPDDLMSAAEVFLTGTSALVMPVASVDDKPIGDQVPGPVSQRLRERFEAVMAGREPDFEHWLSFVDAG